MLRHAVLGLLALCPPALAQDTEEEGRRLSAALTQAGVDTLGACQARVEGMGKLVDQFQGWMEREGHTEQLAGIRSARDKGARLIEDFDGLRTLLGSEAGGFDLDASETARTAMAETFRLRSGESDADAYNRWHTETRLPDACFVAIERARWRVELEELAWEE